MTVLLAGLAVPLLVVALVAAVAGTSFVAAVPPGDAPLQAARRRSRTGLLTGLVAGGLATALLARSDRLGRGLLLAAPLFALFVLAGVLAAELGIRAPARGRRSVTLTPRRARDYVPPNLARAVGGATATMAAVLALTTVSGSTDELGRSGRQLAYSCGALLSGRVGPWPGRYYAVPLALVVGLGLVSAVGTLHAVARRPRPSGEAELADADEQVRAVSGRTVTAAYGLLVAVPLVGVAAVAGDALRRAARPGRALLGTEPVREACGQPWWPAAGWLLLAVALLAMGLFGWCLAVLAAGLMAPRPAATGRDHDRPRPTAAGASQPPTGGAAGVAASRRP